MFFILTLAQAATPLDEPVLVSTEMGNPLVQKISYMSPRISGKELIIDLKEQNYCVEIKHFEQNWRVTSLRKTNRHFEEYALVNCETAIEERPFSESQIHLSQKESNMSVQIA